VRGRRIRTLLVVAASVMLGAWPGGRASAQGVVAPAGSVCSGPASRGAAAVGRAGLKARVAGTVEDADDQHPLASLRVALGSGDRLQALTDDQGHFRLDGVAPGAYWIHVGGPGYGDQTRCVVIPADQEVELVVALHPRPIPLEPLAVTVQGSRPLWLVRTGFYRRMHAGGGVFVTEKDIQRQNPSRLSEMFRSRVGVSLANGDPQPMQALQSTHPPPGVPGKSCPMRDPGLCRHPQDTGPCPIQFLVNGQAVPLILGVDTFHPKDVAGIEAYFHESDIPPEFNVGRAACGVVNIWLKMNPRKPG
jgi:hypothetical protein